jgi:NitT/TauT family transport system permease protein
VTRPGETKPELPGIAVAAAGSSAAAAGGLLPSLPPRRRARRRLRSLSGPVGFVAVLFGALLIWHFAVVLFDVQHYILPKPLTVLDSMQDNWGLLWTHTLWTAQEMAIGFGLAALTGVTLAALMHYFRLLDVIFAPLLVTFQTIPKVALAPLFLVWFGFSLLPRVLVALAIAFFPIVIDTLVGLRSTKKSAIELVRALGGSRWEVFWKVELPSSLPSLFGGLKVASTLVVIGAVVSEYIVGNQGLGYLQLQASYKLDAPLIFAAVGMMAALGLVAYEIVAWAERILLPWRKH